MKINPPAVVKTGPHRWLLKGKRSQESLAHPTLLSAPGSPVIAYSGTTGRVPFYLGLLAQLYGQAGRAEKGLSLLAEARELGAQRGDGWSEAELYRLTGELTLQKSMEQRARGD